MSNDKLYAVKNDEGKYWDFMDGSGFYTLNTSRCLTTLSKKQAELVAKDRGGHVVTFVEKPEKVVLSEKQAEIVEGANKSQFPASYISDHTGISYCLEKLLMDAYANGYTVAKEKKYNVKVPHTKGCWYYKARDAELLTICPDDKKLRGKSTEAEIEHYGLQDCEKEEVTDDDIR